MKKVKVGKRKFTTPISNDFLSENEKSYYGKKLNMVLLGVKKYKNFLMNSNYDLRLIVDYDLDVNISYNDGLLRVIFYIKNSGIPEPCSAYEMPINLIDYLDIVYRIFDSQ